MKHSMLAGVRVLVLEDDAMINLETCETLRAFGCGVSDFLHLHEAAAAVERELPDIAVLDVNLHGKENSYALAARLRDCGVPVVFLTGYDGSSLQAPWHDHPTVQKPCNSLELRAALVRALAAKSTNR